MNGHDWAVDMNKVNQAPNRPSVPVAKNCRQRRGRDCCGLRSTEDDGAGVTEVVVDRAQQRVDRKIARKWAKLPPGMAMSPAGITTTTGVDGGLKSSASARGNYLE